MKGNVFKNKRVLIEAVHKQKAEKVREKAIADQFEARRAKNKATRERKAQRREERLTSVSRWCRAGSSGWEVLGGKVMLGNDSVGVGQAVQGGNCSGARGSAQSRAGTGGMRNVKVGNVVAGSTRTCSRASTCTCLFVFATACLLAAALFAGLCSRACCKGLFVIPATVCLLPCTVCCPLIFCLPAAYWHAALRALFCSPVCCRACTWSSSPPQHSLLPRPQRSEAAAAEQHSSSSGSGARARKPAAPFAG